MAMSSQRLHVNSKGIVENVLYSLADSNPQQYANGFQKLATWVDNSLDIYRVTSLLGPVMSACCKPSLAPAIRTTAASVSLSVCILHHFRLHTDLQQCVRYAQGELSRILYPIFIHCYLELISLRAISEAHQLLNKQSPRFTSSGESSAKMRKQVGWQSYQCKKMSLPTVVKLAQDLPM